MKKRISLRKNTYLTYTQQNKDFSLKSLRKLASDCGPCRQGFHCNNCLCCLPEEAVHNIVSYSQQVQRNPYLVYLGGLDKASRSTMVSAARKAVSVLSSDKTDDPETFPWHEIDYAVVMRLRQLLCERELASRTIDKILSLVRGVMRQTWLLNYISDDTFHKILEVKPLNDQRLPVGRYVERNEVAALLKICREEDSVCGLRDAALIAFLVGAGLREKEAVKLSCADYNAKTKTVKVRFGKKRKQREAYLLNIFSVVIDRWFEMYGASEDAPMIPRIAPMGSIIRPFRYVSTQAVHLALAKRAAKAKIGKSFTPHDLRRTFITHQLERGVDPLRLARAVGHENPSTTMLYDRRTAESDRQAITGEPGDTNREEDEAALAETLALF